MAVFGFFVLMGQQTAVSQMVLSRAAFGRRGAYLPALMQGLLAVGWCAINTWIILDLVIALFDKIGIHGGDGLKIGVADRDHGDPGLAGRDRLPGDRSVRAVDRPGHDRRARSR